MRLGPLLTSTVTVFSIAHALPSKSTTINVLYRHDRNDEKHGIAAFNGAKQLIGHTCDYTLDHGNFAAEHIQFKVDEKASGEIIIGGKTYPVHSKAEHSGGPTCNRIYSDNEIELDCTVTMDAKFVGKPISINETQACFGGDLTAFDLAQGVRILDTSKAGPVDRRSAVPVTKSELNEPENVDKRSSCSSSETTVAIKSVIQQQYFAEQYSKNIECGSSSSCSASVTSSNSHTFTFTSSFELYKWISAGFSVSKTFTESASYTCGGTKGETVCVWYNAAHTKYQAQNQISLYCDDATGGTSLVESPSVLVSPNSNGKGSKYYCVIGTCRDKGEGYWNPKGRYGGPNGVNDLGDAGVRP
ncbi:hypothetical protein N7478_012665 [Penicillium angulare]|uniref:uncharacterized protein n=1 Tax=Penicillium angulare TaxID=116970 RepID=UPI00253F91CF|nr:uncharacterized protein N7478_012665 [Penicillium angulare]KAJ5256561.1 hypothetical protein N7478_012665 [Penicillium angulare]